MVPTNMVADRACIAALRLEIALIARVSQYNLRKLCMQARCIILLPVLFGRYIYQHYQSSSHMCHAQSRYHASFQYHTPCNGPRSRDKLPSTLVFQKKGRSTPDIIRNGECNVESGVTIQVLQITTNELAAGYLNKLLSFEYERTSFDWTLR